MCDHVPRVRLGVLLTSVILLAAYAAGQVVLVVYNLDAWWFIAILFILAVVVGYLGAEEPPYTVLALYTVLTVVNVVIGILVLRVSLIASVLFLILAVMELVFLTLFLKGWFD